MISTAIKNAQGSRASQQDFARVTEIAGGAAQLIVLADGVGGGVSGERAAKLCVDEFIIGAQRGDLDAVASRPERLLELLSNANRRIHRDGQEFPEHQGMATTVVAAILTDRDVEWISVGDSHLYIVGKDGLIKLNDDHSMRGLADDVAAGAAEPPRRWNELRSAVAGVQIPLIDQPEEPYRLAETDICLLASDGLDTLDPQEIMKTVTSTGVPTARGIATKLLDTVLAKRALGQDNISIIIGCNEAALAGAIAPAVAVGVAQAGLRSTEAGPGVDLRSKDTGLRDTVPSDEAAPPPQTAAQPSPIASDQRRPDTARPGPAAAPPRPRPRFEHQSSGDIRATGSRTTVIVVAVLIGIGVLLGFALFDRISRNASANLPANELTSQDLAIWEPRITNGIYHEFWTAPVGSLRECMTACLRMSECVFLALDHSPRSADAAYNCRMFDRHQLARRLRPWQYSVGKTRYLLKRSTAP